MSLSDPKPTPDNPVSFGRKCSWLAVQCNNPLEIVKALQLIDIRESGWRSGVNASRASSQGHVFVSPPVKEWVLAIGDFPTTGDRHHLDLCTPLLLKLGQQFSDVQFFGTHRVTSYCAWARLVEGQIIRQYSWIDGASYWDVGVETPEEVSLGMHFEDSANIDWPEDEAAADELAETYPIPGESDVLNIAGAWSIDPTTLSQQDLPPSIGYLGRFPEQGLV